MAKFKISINRNGLTCNTSEREMGMLLMRKKSQDYRKPQPRQKPKFDEQFHNIRFLKAL